MGQLEDIATPRALCWAPSRPCLLHSWACYPSWKTAVCCPVQMSCLETTEPGLPLKPSGDGTLGREVV